MKRTQNAELLQIKVRLVGIKDNIPVSRLFAKRLRDLNLLLRKNLEGPESPLSIIYGLCFSPH